MLTKGKCCIDQDFFVMCCSAMHTLQAIVVIHVTSKPPNLSCHESEKYFLDPNNGHEKVPFPSIEDPSSVDLTVIVPAYNEEDRCMYDMRVSFPFMQSSAYMGLSVLWFCC